MLFINYNLCGRSTILDMDIRSVAKCVYGFLLFWGLDFVSGEARLFCELLMDMLKFRVVMILSFHYFIQNNYIFLWVQRQLFLFSFWCWGRCKLFPSDSGLLSSLSFLALIQWFFFLFIFISFDVVRHNLLPFLSTYCWYSIPRNMW